MNRELKASLCGLVFLLTACGSDSNDATVEEPQTTLQTGVLIDSKVANISYQTDSQSGLTNIHGEFKYLAGESITFSIGALKFPAVKAAGVITPMTLAGHPSVYNQSATNIGMLLQSLDEDGVLAGGITIPAGAVDAVPQTLDFNVPTAEFVINADVINLVANAGSLRTRLITATDAQTHMQASLDTLTPYIGAWSSVSDNNTSHLVLFANNTFLYAENDAELPNGLEFGNYSFDNKSGELIFTITYDNNGPGDDSGVGDIGTDVTTATALSNDNNTLKIVNGGIELTAQNLSSSSVVGAWSPENNSGNLHMIFFSNNTFMIAESTDRSPNGLQLGTFSYDQNSQEITLSLTYNDTSDQSDIGGTESDMIMSAELSSDNNTLSLMNGGLVLKRSL